MYVVYVMCSVTTLSVDNVFIQILHRKNEVELPTGKKKRFEIQTFYGRLHRLSSFELFGILLFILCKCLNSTF